MNYVMMISRNDEYTNNQVFDSAEKKYGVRPTGCKRVNIYPGINFEYVSVYEVYFS